MKALKKGREKLLPWVKDWTDSYDKIRYSNNVKAMTYEEWFWFHPSAYWLLSFGINAIGILAFGFLLFYSIYKGSSLLAVISGIFTLGNVVSLFKKVKKYRYNDDITFYDLYLRDYEVKNEN